MRLVQIVILILIFSISSIMAQQESKQMTEEMKVWMEYGTPGEIHKNMADRVGKWKVITEMWMQPGVEPMKSEGTVDYKMLLGGRYLEGWHKGTSMGMPFEGISVEAYDNSTKEYITTWIDSFGTGITLAKGKYDKENDLLISYGTMVDPMKGEDVKYKTVVKTEGKDKGIFDMYMILPDGKEFLSMRMTYVREK